MPTAELPVLVGLSTFSPGVGYVLTSILIGRGRNGASPVHDLVNLRLTGEAKLTNPS